MLGSSKRIFENLLAFAINSAPRGTVRVDAENDEIDGVYCHVHHNGSVLDPDSVSQLFDNDSGDVKTPNDGIGLGLTIVRQLVEAHGGEVSATSDEKSGTTIKFRLPVGKRSN